MVKPMKRRRMSQGQMVRISPSRFGSKAARTMPDRAFPMVTL
jgi:hypothetical protein